MISFDEALHFKELILSAPKINTLKELKNVSIERRLNSSCTQKKQKTVSLTNLPVNEQSVKSRRQNEIKLEET